MPELNADIVIIGSGPGGYVSAIRAAELKKKVVVVERDRLGGECLNYGCIPTKTMISTSKLYSRLSLSSKYGIHVGSYSIDLMKLKQWKEDVVSRLVKGIEMLLEGYGVKLIYGEARINNKNKVTVKGNNEDYTINTSNIIIATGTKHASLPNIKPDGDTVITSKEAISLEKLPESILMIGGGAIGLEFACMYQNMGSRVYVVELMDQLLPGTDPELVRVVQRKLESKGAKIYLKSTASSITKQGNGAVVRVNTQDGEREINVEKVLLSVGKVPCLDGIDVSSLGIKTDSKGYIITDKRMMTSVEGIYAIGDVRGPPLLAHKASKEGIVAAENASGMQSYADWNVVPDAIFTDPEIASAGMTERKAVELGYEIKKARFNFAALGRALASDEGEGFVKIVADAKTDTVLGVQIVGPEASNLISEAALAIEMGAKIEDIALTIHPHPTLPEAIMEAAEVAAGRPIHQLRL
jgi:dihydrolipoamide dehydrogenase